MATLCNQKPSTGIKVIYIIVYQAIQRPTKSDMLREKLRDSATVY